MDAEVEIIRLLKSEAAGYVSGQALSTALGVSRTAVWKHIKNLRSMGYAITASPSKGYVLIRPLGAGAQDAFNRVEVSSILTTDIIGRKIFFYPETGSTNTRAFELGRRGEPEGAAVIADRQTAGKGRLGRKWASPPGVNFYTSVILRPKIPPEQAQRFALLMAVAAAEAVSGFSPKRVCVKWPNDILIDSKKVAGILMEMDAEPDRVNFIVAGVGVNINMTAADMPEEIRAVATSIREKSGKETPRAEFARALYSAMEKWYKVFLAEGFVPVVKAWRGYFDAEGRTVKVTAFDRVITGVCAGIDESGALLLRTPAGGLEKIISGDVETVRSL